MPRAGHSILVFKPFTFDPVSGELKRNGQKIRMPEQPCRLLTVLLENAGDLVTRSALRERLWSSDEHLNHDHSISNVVNQLRTILRDRTDSPIYIETVPKRGYRFLAPVNELIAEAPAVESKAVSTVEETVALPDMSEPAGARADGSSRRGLLIWLGLGLVVLLGSAAMFFVRRARTPAPPTDISMGIASFDADGPGARELADGLRLDLIDSLSQMPRIQVRSAHSFSNAGRDDASVRTLAKKLNLDVMLFGKISVSGNALDLSLELVRGRDSTHLASLHYTCAKDAIGSIRDEMQRDLFARLESSTLSAHRVSGSTDNPQAYEAYLEARARLLNWTDQPVSTVLSGFQNATAIDPGFAKAYAEIATVHVLAAEHSLAPRDESYRQAEQFANKAIALDPSQAEAHAALGFIEFRRDWDAHSAEIELRQAVSLEPNQAIHHVMLALLLGNTGRFDESFQQVDLAHADDPLWPPVYLTEMYLASSAHLDHRAIASADELLKLKPDWPLALDQRAWAIWYAGQTVEAIDAWRSMAALEKDQERVALEDDGLRAFREHGLEGYARVRLSAIQSGHNWAHPNDFEPAEWYVDAGEDQEALAAIKKMVDLHDPEALQLAVSPAYTPLHHNPEFVALVSRVGLTIPPEHPR